jgi:hypothetical protein
MYFNPQDIQLNYFICCKCRTKANKNINNQRSKTNPFNFIKVSGKSNNNDEDSIDSLHESFLLNKINETHDPNDSETDYKTDSADARHKTDKQVKLYKACSSH